MNSIDLAVIVVGALAIFLALAKLAGGGRRTSARVSDFQRSAGDVTPGAFPADSGFYDHDHDRDHGGHGHHSASPGYTAHVGHDGGGYGGFDGGHSGFDGGHGGFDAGGGGDGDGH